MLWKTIINLGTVSLVLTQPVNAHRKYWENTNQDPTIAESEDLDFNDDTSSDRASIKNSNRLKKGLSKPQSNLEKLQNSTPEIPKKNSTETPKMPTAIKGVGVPGSPYQKEVLPNASPKDSASSSKAEDVNTSHGHLIQIPHTSPGENP